MDLLDIQAFTQHVESRRVTAGLDPLLQLRFLRSDLGPAQHEMRFGRLRGATAAIASINSCCPFCSENRATSPMRGVWGASDSDCLNR